MIRVHHAIERARKHRWLGLLILVLLALLLALLVFHSLSDSTEATAELTCFFVVVVVVVRIVVAPPLPRTTASRQPARAPPTLVRPARLEGRTLSVLALPLRL